MRTVRCHTRKDATSCFTSVSIAISVYSPSDRYCTERTLGGLDVFLPYIHDYVNTFTGKSITTEQWKTHLYAYFERNGGAEKIKALNSVDWNVSVLILTLQILGQSLTNPITGVVLWRRYRASSQDGIRHIFGEQRV